MTIYDRRAASSTRLCLGPLTMHCWYQYQTSKATAVHQKIKMNRQIYLFNLFVCEPNPETRRMNGLSATAKPHDAKQDTDQPWALGRTAALTARIRSLVFFVDRPVLSTHSSFIDRRLKVARSSRISKVEQNIDRADVAVSCRTLRLRGRRGSEAKGSARSTQNYGISQP